MAAILEVSALAADTLALVATTVVPSASLILTPESASAQSAASIVYALEL